MVLRSLCLLLFATVALTAGEPSPLMPADARWMIHADVAALTAGVSGAWMDEVAQRPVVDAKLNAFFLITGMKPLRDLAAVTLYGTDNRPESGILALRGRFDSERLVALAKAAQAYRAEERQGLTVHSWFDPQQQRRVHASFVGEDLLVFGSSARHLVAAADALRNWQPPAGAEQPLLVLAVAEGIDRWQDLHPQAAMLRHLSAVALRLTERDDALVLRLRLVARDENTAVHIGQVLQGLRALALLNEEYAPRLQRLLDALALEREGSAVHLDLTLPWADLREAAAVWEAQLRSGGAGEP